MTTLRDLKDLHAITNARYAQRQQSFARLVEREAQIRAELQRVDDMDRASRATGTDVIPMRAIGADVIWHGWMGRTRAALNAELAQVLAIKAQHLKEVQRTYGKLMVVEEMQRNLKDQLKRDAHTAELDRAIDLSVTRRADPAQ
ncbi:MAG: hypothetical protein AAF744_01700 [Pseudomonadota bacterium]